MKKISPALIEKFLSNQCTHEEAVQVQLFFDTYPDELEKYMPVDHLLRDELNTKLSSSVSQKMLGQIEKNIVRQTKAVRLHTWLKYAAAAAITGVISFTAIQLFNTKNNFDNTKDVAIHVTVKQSSDSIKVIANNTKSPMLVSLQDGSSVKLFPKSTLQYAQSYNDTKRALQLTGIAFFKVAKNKSKPFIVATGNISTTALGTSFTVYAEKNSTEIIVKLHTGKVAVNKVNNSGAAFNTTYLTPGEQINVNTNSFIATVSKFELQHTVKQRSNNVLQNADDNTLDFKQAALSDVFEKLEKQYQINITYTASDVVNMTFTGKFEPGENISTILNNITLLNGLTISETTTGYIITK